HYQIPVFVFAFLKFSLMAATDVEYRCFVGGLAWATDSNALEKAFSTYGDVLDSKVRLLQASRRI
ncbi:hypothetical protein EYC94_25860, partial [Enterobacter hormaechei]